MKTRSNHPVPRPARMALAAVVAAAMAIGAAGCGDDDTRLSKAETAEHVNASIQTVNGEFQAVFQALGETTEDAVVPADVRDRLATAADVERREADEAGDVEPPEGGEQAIDGFVAAAKKQADALTRAAARDDLTVAEMADLIEHPEMEDALAELARLGLATPPPAHQ